MSARKHLKAAVKKANNGKHRVARRWHRRLGLTSAVAVILLSISGIMLNHVSDLYEENEFVSSSWLLDWYDIEPATEIVSYPIPQNSKSLLWADGTMLLGHEFRRFNQSELIGVFVDAEIIYAFNRTKVFLFTRDGEFVEELSYSDDARVDAVYTTQSTGKVALVSGDRVTALDVETLNFSATTVEDSSLEKDLKLTLRSHLPDSAEAQLARQHVLLKSSVLTDLHSGRIFGRWGALLMDLFALCFLLLAATGIVAWLRRSPR